MYSLITSAMTWSYSRIAAFCQCPYKFFLTYIQPCASDPLFFSEYGQFMHELFAGFYSGALSRFELVSRYLSGFQRRVTSRAPSSKIFSSYFRQGAEALNRVSHFGDVLGVEQEVSFYIEDLPFTGFVDLVLRAGKSAGQIFPSASFHKAGLCLVDHKSRILKPRSTRGHYTQSDATLDSYLRQLYLYSIPVHDLYGQYPSHLVFHCYRSGDWVFEPFSVAALNESKAWAVDTVRRICASQEWPPNLDYFFCKHLCGVHNHCEYCALQFGQ